MIMARRTLRIAEILGSVLLFGGTANAAVPLPGSGDRWRTIEAGGFIVFSDASSSEMKALTTNLTQMRATFGSISRIEVRSAQPITVFLFDDTKEFAPYRDTVLGRPAPGVAGVFLHGPNDRDCIILDGEHREAGQSIAYHELTHFFVANSALQVPLWFNEGFAEFNSTFETNGKTAKVGVPVMGDLQILRTHHRLPLRRLFEVTQDSPEYTEQGHMGVFYAQSWALMHYFLTGPLERRKQLASFINALNQHRPLEEAFRSSFGCDFELMETELSKHIWRSSLPYAVVDVGAFTRSPLPRPQPTARDELLFQLGALLAQCRGCDLADARRFTTQALNLNPSAVAARSLLELLETPLPGPAMGWPRHLAPVAPTHPEPPPSDAKVAEGIVARLLGRPAPWSDADRAELLRARQLFERETMRDPNSTRACNGLAETYAFPGEDVSTAISGYERSLTIDPKQGAVARKVVELCADHGERSRAAALIDDLASKGLDPDSVRECNDTLAAADADEGARLMNSGRAEEGLVVLRRGLETAASPELRSRLRQDVTRVRAQLNRAHEVDLFNRAAQKAKEGDMVGAYQLVETLLEIATDLEVVEHAKSLKEKLLPYVTNVGRKP